MREKWDKLQDNPWINLLTKIIITVCLVLLVLHFVMGVSVLHKINMVPAIKDGDLLITYKLDKNIYSDLIVEYEKDNNKMYGRVIGVPGDIIYINKEGTYTINGNITQEKIYYNTFPDENSIIKYPYEVPSDSYFIMNDYREDTNDSRRFGAVHKDDINGQMFLQLRRRGF